MSWAYCRALELMPVHGVQQPCLGRTQLLVVVQNADALVRSAHGRNAR